MAKPVEVINKQVEKAKAQYQKQLDIYNDPSSTPEEKAEAEETMDDMLKKLEKLGEPAPTPTT